MVKKVQKINKGNSSSGAIRTVQKINQVENGISKGAVRKVQKIRKVSQQTSDSFAQKYEKQRAQKKYERALETKPKPTSNKTAAEYNKELSSWITKNKSSLSNKYTQARFEKEVTQLQKNIEKKQQRDIIQAKKEISKGVKGDVVEAAENVSGTISKYQSSIAGTKAGQTILKRAIKQYEAHTEKRFEEAIKAAPTTLPGQSGYDSAVKDWSNKYKVVGMPKYSSKIEQEQLKLKVKKLSNDPNYNVTRDSSGKITSISAKPVEYTSYYKRKSGESAKRTKKTYIPYVLTLKDGKVIKEIERDTYNTEKRKTDDYRKEREGVYDKVIKQYEDGKIVSLKEFDDYKSRDKRYDDGYKRYYDTFLKTDIDYSNLSKVEYDRPDSIKKIYSSPQLSHSESLAKSNAAALARNSSVFHLSGKDDVKSYVNNIKSQSLSKPLEVTSFSKGATAGDVYRALEKQGSKYLDVKQLKSDINQIRTPKVEVIKNQRQTSSLLRVPSSISMEGVQLNLDIQKNIKTRERDSKVMSMLSNIDDAGRSIREEKNRETEKILQAIEKDNKRSAFLSKSKEKASSIFNESKEKASNLFDKSKDIVSDYITKGSEIIKKEFKDDLFYKAAATVIPFTKGVVKKTKEYIGSQYDYFLGLDKKDQEVSLSQDRPNLTMTTEDAKVFGTEDQKTPKEVIEDVTEFGKSVYGYVAPKVKKIYDVSSEFVKSELNEMKSDSVEPLYKTFPVSSVESKGRDNFYSIIGHPFQRGKEAVEEYIAAKEKGIAPSYAVLVSDIVRPPLTMPSKPYTDEKDGYTTITGQEYDSKYDALKSTEELWNPLEWETSFMRNLAISAESKVSDLITPRINGEESETVRKSIIEKLKEKRAIELQTQMSEAKGWKYQKENFQDYLMNAGEYVYGASKIGADILMSGAVPGFFVPKGVTDVYKKTKSEYDPIVSEFFDDYVPTGKTIKAMRERESISKDLKQKEIELIDENLSLIESKIPTKEVQLKDASGRTETMFDLKSIEDQENYSKYVKLFDSRQQKETELEKINAQVVSSKDIPFIDKVVDLGTSPKTVETAVTTALTFYAAPGSKAFLTSLEKTKVTGFLPKLGVGATKILGRSVSQVPDAMKVIGVTDSLLRSEIVSKNQAKGVGLLLSPFSVGMSAGVSASASSFGKESSSYETSKDILTDVGISFATGAAFGGLLKVGGRAAEKGFKQTYRGLRSVLPKKAADMALESVMVGKGAEIVRKGTENVIQSYFQKGQISELINLQKSIGTGDTMNVVGSASSFIAGELGEEAGEYTTGKFMDFKKIGDSIVKDSIVASAELFSSELKHEGRTETIQSGKDPFLLLDATTVREIEKKDFTGKDPKDVVLPERDKLEKKNKEFLQNSDYAVLVGSRSLAPQAAKDWEISKDKDFDIVYIGENKQTGKKISKKKLKKIMENDVDNLARDYYKSFGGKDKNVKYNEKTTTASDGRETTIKTLGDVVKIKKWSTPDGLEVNTISVKDNGKWKEVNDIKLNKNKRFESTKTGEGLRVSSINYEVKRKFFTSIESDTAVGRGREKDLPKAEIVLEKFNYEPFKKSPLKREISFISRGLTLDPYDGTTRSLLFSPSKYEKSYGEDSGLPMLYLVPGRSYPMFQKGYSDVVKIVVDADKVIGLDDLPDFYKTPATPESVKKYQIENIKKDRGVLYKPVFPEQKKDVSFLTTDTGRTVSTELKPFNKPLTKYQQERIKQIRDSKISQKDALLVQGREYISFLSGKDGYVAPSPHTIMSVSFSGQKLKNVEFEKVMVGDLSIKKIGSSIDKSTGKVLTVYSNVDRYNPDEGDSKYFKTKSLAFKTNKLATNIDLAMRDLRLKKQRIKGERKRMSLMDRLFGETKKTKAQDGMKQLEFRDTKLLTTSQKELDYDPDNALINFNMEELAESKKSTEAIKRKTEREERYFSRIFDEGRRGDAPIRSILRNTRDNKRSRKDVYDVSYELYNERKTTKRPEPYRDSFYRDIINRNKRTRTEREPRRDQGRETKEIERYNFERIRPDVGRTRTEREPRRYGPEEITKEIKSGLFFGKQKKKTKKSKKTKATGYTVKSFKTLDLLKSKKSKKTKGSFGFL